jgi:hypothetical protein
MKPNVPAVISACLVGVSVFMLPQSFRTYWSAQAVVQPNIQALSPEQTAKRVSSVVLPLLPAGPDGELARSVLQSQASEANGLHAISTAQAKSHVLAGKVQAVAWLSVLVLSLVLVAKLWPSKRSEA